jgi:hypothetical protein
LARLNLQSEADEPRALVRKLGNDLGFRTSERVLGEAIARAPEPMREGSARENAQTLGLGKASLTAVKGGLRSRSLFPPRLPGEMVRELDQQARAENVCRLREMRIKRPDVRSGLDERA